MQVSVNRNRNLKTDRQIEREREWEKKKLILNERMRGLESTAWLQDM